MKFKMSLSHLGVSEENVFENVDGRWTAESLVYNKLTHEPLAQVS